MSGSGLVHGARGAGEERVGATVTAAATAAAATAAAAAAAAAAGGAWQWKSVGVRECKNGRITDWLQLPSWRRRTWRADQDVIGGCGERLACTQGLVWAEG
jgi:hypothetical protein